MDIKCKKTNCLFNEKTSCIAGEIEVGADLDCKTYQKNEILNTRPGQKTYTEAGSFDLLNGNKLQKVGCGATKCLFNKAGSCSASNISVLSGRGKSAFCATNIEK